MTIPYLANPGSAVLKRVPTTGLERAEADTDAERLLDIDVEQIIDQWDPDKVATHNLPVLAFGMAVTLWESDYWHEATQRQWLRDQWTFKSKVGTQRAIEMALGVSGYDLKQVVAPPQGTYASEDMTKAEWDAWIHLMPELRITHASYPGVAGDLASFEGDYADNGGAWDDYGPTQYGRFGFIRFPNGSQIDLRVISSSTTDGVNVQVEQYALPGNASLCAYEGDFADVDSYASDAATNEQLVTVALDRTYASMTTGARLTAVVPGLTPLSINFDVTSDVGNAGMFMFEGDYIDDPYTGEVGDDPAPFLIADRVYLNDPTVAAPMLTGVSFADVDRVGIEPNTAELLIDLHLHASTVESFVDEACADYNYAVEQDTSHFERAYRAVIAAKALRDTTLVSFDVLRQMELRDAVGCGIGQIIDATL